MRIAGSPFETTHTRYGLFGPIRRVPFWNRPIRHIGFTMIEMLIVMVIIGTLLAIALPMLQSVLDQARITRYRIQLTRLARIGA